LFGRGRPARSTPFSETELAKPETLGGGLMMTPQAPFSEKDLANLAKLISAGIHKQELNQELKNISNNLLINHKSLIVPLNKKFMEDFLKLDLAGGITVDARNMILIALAHEIRERDIPGAIAELGVYRGVFASRIRKLLPGRIFYLFDTFEGFCEQQKIIDEHKYSMTAQDFSSTSVELALRNIGDTKMCEVCKGLFPETTLGIDEHFAFVSLDVDLYQPTLDGLRFFYPRLSRGGYILIHDYGSTRYIGVSEAVNEFCRDAGIGYVPVPDTCRSAVISK